MTEAQAEALDAVHFTAARHAVKIHLDTGDMCFINNFAIMHCRDAFSDDRFTKRYLMRLWLNNPERCWEVPLGLRPAWERIYEPWEGIEDVWDQDPFVDPITARSRLGGDDQSTSCG